jgi:hypothetical protein
VWREAVGVDVEVGVGASVLEAEVLFSEEVGGPARSATPAYRVERGIEIDQQIGPGTLPQVGHIRVLLGDGARRVAAFAEGLDESGLARGADADDNYSRGKGIDRWFGRGMVR